MSYGRHTSPFAGVPAGRSPGELVPEALRSSRGLTRACRGSKKSKRLRSSSANLRMCRTHTQRERSPIDGYLFPLITGSLCLCLRRGPFVSVPGGKTTGWLILHALSLSLSAALGERDAFAQVLQRVCSTLSVCVFPNASTKAATLDSLWFEGGKTQDKSYCSRKRFFFFSAARSATDSFEKCSVLLTRGKTKLSPSFGSPIKRAAGLCGYGIVFCI